MKNKVVKKKYKFTNKLQKKFLSFSKDTDQTANIMKIKSLNPTKKMIPLIKKFLAHND